MSSWLLSVKNPYAKISDVDQIFIVEFILMLSGFSDMSQLVDATLTLLREESACQQLENESDIDDDDDTEHDEILMDAVSDLLPAFAKSMGSHFAPIFAKLFEPLMKFAVGYSS